MRSTKQSILKCCHLQQRPVFFAPHLVRDGDELRTQLVYPCNEFVPFAILTKGLVIHFVADRPWAT